MYIDCPSITILELNVLPIWVFLVSLLNHTLRVISIVSPAGNITSSFIILSVNDANVLIPSSSIFSFIYSGENVLSLVDNNFILNL